MSNILSKINGPEDVKNLNFTKLDLLATELRRELINIVSSNGGHLASNLGIVELTLAVHKVFSSPIDKIVFDVGHQCYVHKMVTGRRDKMHTLRKLDGISGFPKPEESCHDSFVAGHSSTAISAAIGMATAKKIKGESGQVIAIVGDGALTGGISFEAINNASSLGLDNLIIIVNDNRMSISKNVGALSRHLSAIRNDPKYYHAKDSVTNILLKVPVIGKPSKNLITKTKGMVKGALYNSNYFEDLGLQYLGPIDGHDIKSLCEVLTRAKLAKSAIVINVETVKGKGYTHAEENPGQFHGTPTFDIETGNPDIQNSNSFSSIFGHELVKLAEKNDKICAITAAMKYGTELQHFAAKFKDRFFDVGIAEEHAVIHASAMASQGMIPVFAVYSSFLQRTFDQLIHDCAILQNHVVIAVDRAGIVGEDGETHQGVFDVPMLLAVPGITIFSPSNYEEVKICLDKAVNECKGLCIVRYPRGGEGEVANIEATTDYSLCKRGSNRLIVSYGRLVNNVYSAADDCDILKLVRISDIFDSELLSEMLNYKEIVFFEESFYKGSLSMELGSILMQNSYTGKYRVKAIDGFIKQASPSQIFEQLGFDKEGIKSFLKQEN